MFLTLAVGFCVAAAPEDAGKKALDAIQGEWVVEKAVTLENEQAQDGITGQSLVFTGKKWKFSTIIEGELVSLDPTTTPMIIDMKATPKEGGEIPIEGIYKLTDDTLMLSVHVGEDRNRPAGFDKPTESGTVVLTLKKFKAK